MTGSSTSSKATTCRSRIVHPPPTIANRARLFVNDRRVVRLTLTPSAVIIAITAIAVGGGATSIGAASALRQRGTNVRNQAAADQK